MGRSLSDLPIVVQYNKRDLPDAMPIARTRTRSPSASTRRSASVSGRASRIDPYASGGYS